MEHPSCTCPRCREPLETVLAQCYSWTPVDTGETFLVLGVEPLFKCLPCEQFYFGEELAAQGLLPAA